MHCNLQRICLLFTVFIQINSLLLVQAEGHGRRGHAAGVKGRRSHHRRQNHRHFQADEGAMEGDFPAARRRLYKNIRDLPPQQTDVCPRDEDLALTQGRTCLKKCIVDEDCRSPRKKCLCDGICGLSCIKPDRECYELSKPDKGNVMLTGRLFADRAIYTCDEDYRLVGVEFRLCQADGSWSATEPSCHKNTNGGYCGEPPVVQHARHNAPLEQSSFTLDTELQYQCYPGYNTLGFARARCLALNSTVKWFGPDVTCEPRSCGDPGDIPQGRHEGDCHAFSCRVTYSCDPGFDLVGRANRYCQADGTWTPLELPICVPVQCPIPQNPEHGKAIYTSISYNSVVSYECRHGNTLVGLLSRRCGADKNWIGEQPTCKEINCGAPGPIYNGWIEHTDTGASLGASIIYRCFEGMKRHGASSATCDKNARWSNPPPQCLSSCVVPIVDNGVLKNVTLNPSDSVPANRTAPDVPALGVGTLVQHSENLTLECTQLYEPTHGHSVVTCNNGTWNVIPKCEPARCKSLPKRPRHGMVIAPQIEHGTQALYKCKDGFQLVGSNVTKCMYGTWTSSIPDCQEIYCPFPGYIEHGKVLLVGNMGLYDYRPYVRKVTNNRQIMYECDRGYMLDDGPPGATCVAGRWSPKEMARCIRGQHPQTRWRRSANPLLVTMTTTTTTTTTQQPPEAAAVEKVIENPHRRHQNHAADQAEDIRRKRSARTSVRVPTGSAMRNRGNKGRGSSIRRKLTNKVKNSGQGGGGQRHDYPNWCTPLTEEANGVVDIVKPGKNQSNVYSTDAVIRVTCNKGYSLNIGNNRTARCKRGSWRPDIPVCMITPCEIPDIENAIFKYSDAAAAAGSEVTHNDTATFGCIHGYVVQGPEVYRCLYGEFSVDQKSECTPAPCELPRNPNGDYTAGYRAGLTIANGSTVDYTCNEPEYYKISQGPVHCVLGELVPDFPSCKSRQDRFGAEVVDFSRISWQEFKGGSDITEDGNMNISRSDRKTCPTPSRSHGAMLFKNGQLLNEGEQRFPHGTQVTFHCVSGILKDKTTWQIICEDGNWLGRPLSCDGEVMVEGLGEPSNKSCIFRNKTPFMVTFYEDQQVTEDVVHFPPGTELTSRCSDIGKYAFAGSVRRRCSRGEWTGMKPVCYGLSQENDLAMEKAPTILFRNQLGPIGQSNDGRLIVYPGTILHMECLWMRKFGLPSWNVSHNYRKYPEGWATDKGRDDQLEYRLSIFHAQKDDTGIFTCTTPVRYSHSVEIIVHPVHCAPIPERKGLTVSSKNTKMGSKVKFSCDNGNSLIGTAEVTCLPSGSWNSAIPFCESVLCPDITNSSERILRTSVVSREVGGKAIFSCPPGYIIRGSTGESVCQPSGEWTKPTPHCEEVICDPPSSPENGYIQGGSSYKAGEVVQFHCHRGFMMDGQPIAVCQDNGKWSGSFPKCSTACPYPGTTIGGTISLVKFYYGIGETVTFDCSTGLSLSGMRMLRCQKNGKWSAAVPTCIPSTS